MGQKWIAVAYRVEKTVLTAKLDVKLRCAKRGLNDVAEEIAPAGSSLDNPSRGKVSTNIETRAAYMLSQSALWVVT